MEKIKVLLISTKTNVKNKVELVNNELKNKGEFEFVLYSNVPINEIKEIKTVFLDMPKNELQNMALNNIGDSIILIDLDYSEITIKKVLEEILNNYEKSDIINFKNKENKFVKFINKLKFFIYNFILSLFNIQPKLNINKDFQYLSKNITKVMSNISKSPNSLRLFDNFTGYNQINIEIEKEKVKNKKNVLYKILALIMFVLAIISVLLTIYLAIKFKASHHVSRMILAEIFIFIILIISSLCSLTYSKYINSI